MTRHVPISEFKDHASELIAAAEAGEEIVITRHGRATVRMVREPDKSEDRRRRVEAALASLAQIRQEQRDRGVTTTIDEIIAWKNEGRR